MPRDRHEAAHAPKSSIPLPRPDRRIRVVREHREQAGLQVLHGRRDRRGMWIALREIEPTRVAGVHAPLCTDDGYQGQASWAVLVSIDNGVHAYVITKSSHL